MWLSVAFKLILLILCASQKLDYDFEEITLECVFEVMTDSYGCNAKNLKADSRDTHIDDITGRHKQGRSNNDAVIFYNYNAATRFIPKGIGFIFPNLNTFMITKSQLELVEFRDFKNMRKLTRLYLPQNKITKLPFCMFKYIENLEIIDVSGNQIEELDEDIFTNLPNLQAFRANDNSIIKLDHGLFRNNFNLKEILLQKNNLSVIDLNFMKLKEIQAVDLRRNDCIDVSFIHGEKLSMRDFQNMTAGMCNGTEAVC